MRRLAFLFLFIVSCTPPITLFQRYATVKLDNSSGSAVSLGRGYFLTATHVLVADSFAVYNSKGVDAKPIRLLQFGDMMVFKSDLDTTLPKVVIVEPKIGERVYVIQPVYSDSGVNTLLFQGNIAYISKYYAMIDRPIFAGISGSGVFNKNGELVGMASQLYGISRQVAFGIFIKTTPLKLILEKVR